MPACSPQGTRAHCRATRCLGTTASQEGFYKMSSWHSNPTVTCLLQPGRGFSCPLGFTGMMPSLCHHCIGERRPWTVTLSPCQLPSSFPSQSHPHFHPNLYPNPHPTSQSPSSTPSHLHLHPNFYPNPHPHPITTSTPNPIPIPWDEVGFLHGSAQGDHCHHRCPLRLMSPPCGGAAFSLSHICSGLQEVNIKKKKERERTTTS